MLGRDKDIKYFQGIGRKKGNLLIIFNCKCLWCYISKYNQQKGCNTDGNRYSHISKYMDTDRCNYRRYCYIDKIISKINGYKEFAGFFQQVCNNICTHSTLLLHGIHPCLCKGKECHFTCSK